MLGACLQLAPCAGGSDIYGGNVGGKRLLWPQAQKWLAKKGVKPSLEDESPELGKPRPAGLGLGASFLPHHKVCCARTTVWPEFLLIRRLIASTAVQTALGNWSASARCLLGDATSI